MIPSLLIADVAVRKRRQRQDEITIFFTRTGLESAKLCFYAENAHISCKHMLCEPRAFNASAQHMLCELDSVKCRGRTLHERAFFKTTFE